MARVVALNSFHYRDDVGVAFAGIGDTFDLPDALVDDYVSIGRVRVVEEAAVETAEEPGDDGGAAPEAASEPAAMLLGSNVQPAEIAIGEGSVVPLGAVVARAHAASGLTVAEWNALDADELEKRIAETIDRMRAEAEAGPGDAAETAQDGQDGDGAEAAVGADEGAQTGPEASDEGAEADTEAAGWLKAPEVNAKVRIPKDWESLNGNQVRSLGAKLSDAPIKNADDGRRAVAAELARRAAAA